jgi:hypothetical protein
MAYLMWLMYSRVHKVLGCTKINLPDRRAKLGHYQMSHLSKRHELPKGVSRREVDSTFFVLVRSFQPLRTSFAYRTHEGVASVAINRN